MRRERNALNCHRKKHASFLEVLCVSFKDPTGNEAYSLTNVFPLQKAATLF